MQTRVIVTCRDALGRWRPAALLTETTESGERHCRVDFDSVAAEETPLSSGVLTGGFTDWHVHLHLSDWQYLAVSPIGRVHDLGGSPSELKELAEASAHPLEVIHAGAFLTPVGGYPSDRAWAPADTYREISNSAEAITAVLEMASAGASAIKVASNSTAGPVFSDELFTVIVRTATSLALPVVAHPEGPGEALRAARLGATRLAHAPFSELLSEDQIAELAKLTSWCSTLDIHGWGEYTQAHDIAVANVAAFVRHGGTLLYATDMGNGPTPADLNSRELASLAQAGLTPEQVLDTLTPGDPTLSDAKLCWVPRDEHGALDVAAARPITLNSDDSEISAIIAAAHTGTKARR